ncbi:Nn.00g080710.m01.CDS01 [Neocucurbitaria sp. VM-36]
MPSNAPPSPRLVSRGRQEATTVTPPMLRGNYPSASLSQAASTNTIKSLKSRKKPSKPHRKSFRPYKKATKTHPKILGPIADPEDVQRYKMTKSPLLSLPAELRQMIWEAALTSPTGSLTYDSSKKRFNVSSIGAGLLTTCHFVALETQYLPLQLNKLVFNMPTPANVDFMVFLARLNRLEAALGWVLRMDVRFAKGDDIGKT